MVTQLGQQIREAATGEGKVRQIIFVIGAVILMYIPLSIFINLLADTTVTVNQTLNAAHNMAQYEGTSGFLLAAPWLLYFAPFGLGLILIIGILRRR